jgi:hypothetical protein
MERVVPQTDASHSRYFRFLINHKQCTELWDTWEYARVEPAKKEYLAFCDFLIERGDLEAHSRSGEARFVDGVYPAKPDCDAANVVFNGDFEYPVQDGGFDWKIGKAEGVTIGVDTDVKKTGSSSLTASFSGNTNPGVYLAQQVVRKTERTVP